MASGKNRLAMKRNPEGNGAEEAQKKGFFTVTMALDALLSVTFLVLAAYIWYYAPTVSGNNGRDLFYFSILLGSYGIWRVIRSVIHHRRREEGEAL
jgi:hypothetical protein